MPCAMPPVALSELSVSVAVSLLLSWTEGTKLTVLAQVAPVASVNAAVDCVVVAQGT